MSVSPIQKAGWAMAWAKVTGLPRLSGLLDKVSTDHPRHEDLQEIKRSAESIIKACDEAAELLNSVRRG